MSSAQQRWVESHPYLGSIAEFHRAVSEVFAKLSPRPVSPPDWKMIFEGYGHGIPLIASFLVESEWTSAAGETLLAGSTELLQYKLEEPVRAAAEELREHLLVSEENRTTAIDWVQIGDPEDSPLPDAGLLRLLVWEAIRRTLAPVLKSYAELRKEDDWMRAYCPVCGALPGMAQIVPEGGPRILACGYCRSSWQFRRIGCPFCENDDQNQLTIFTIQEEPLFRLDACRACNGYLKTYIGDGDLELYLSDWSTLHLDILATEHELERKGACLFEI